MDSAGRQICKDGVGCFRIPFLLYPVLGSCYRLGADLSSSAYCIGPLHIIITRRCTLYLAVGRTGKAGHAASSCICLCLASYHFFPGWDISSCIKKAIHSRYQTNPAAVFGIIEERVSTDQSRKSAFGSLVSSVLFLALLYWRVENGE